MAFYPDIDPAEQAELDYLLAQEMAADEERRSLDALAADVLDDRAERAASPGTWFNGRIETAFTPA